MRVIAPEEITVGTKFQTRGKHPRKSEVIDILRTTNLKGEIVKTEFLCQYEFLGQKITHREVAVTIQRGHLKK